MDYHNTPSFYNNEEFFEKYLGQTSYYKALQNAVEKIVGFVHPNKVLELGSALGTTTIQLANQYPDTNFFGIDYRDDIVNKAKEAAKDCKNITFKKEDMTETVEKHLREYDLIFMLYSFHHILDPMEEKENFLKACYKNMKYDSYLLIAETFLPEESAIERDKRIEGLWEQRALEGYASTFWTALQSLDKNDLQQATEVAKKSMEEEKDAGYWVNHRREEYLVKFSWLYNTAKKIGFDIVIAEPVNCIEEKVLLLKKS